MRRYNGAVRDLEDMRVRCYIDEETKCWHFRQANGRPFIYQPKSIPKVFVHQTQKRTSAKRVAWEFSRGKNVPPGWCVAYKCQSFDCINPEHLVSVTPQKLGQMVADSGRSKTPAKSANAKRLARSRANVVLNEELAAWLRDSSQSQVEKAHAIGVRQQVVSDVERGKTWRTETLAPASVFSWRP